MKRQIELHMKQVGKKYNKNTTKTGNLGEALAVEFLVRNNYVIVEQNYWKKFGEIDIIASDSKLVRFVEVKTVTHETRANLEWSVTHETWRPEELVHTFKLRQIDKALQAWIIENRYTGNYQVDVIAVRVVPRETYACINFIENVTI